MSKLLLYALIYQSGNMHFFFGMTYLLLVKQCTLLHLFVVYMAAVFVILFVKVFEDCFAKSVNKTHIYCIFSTLLKTLYHITFTPWKLLPF